MLDKIPCAEEQIHVGLTGSSAQPTTNPCGRIRRRRRKKIKADGRPLNQTQIQAHTLQYSRFQFHRSKLVKMFILIHSGLILSSKIFILFFQQICSFYLH